MAEVVAGKPDRFQGFATLPTPVPLAAARELERAVRELKLQGAMVFGRTGERNFDHHDYWPIFETASALRAPLYLHPQIPQSGVVDAYYNGLTELRIIYLPGPVLDGTMKLAFRSSEWP